MTNEHLTKPHEEVTLEELCLASSACDLLDLHQQQRVCAALLSRLESEDILSEIERRNKEGESLLNLMYADDRYYVYDALKDVYFPVRPTITEAFAAFKEAEKK